MFVGRQKELKRLQSLVDKKVASFVVITGRRRIGKSRLVEEFGRSFGRFYQFTGLSPEKGITAQSQRDEFALQLARQVGLPGLTSTDWTELFTVLARHTQRGKVLVVLDEISWMASHDPEFLAKLKNAWDLFFKKNPKLVLVVCGSVSSWIDENIMSSTGFVGRVSLKLILRELPLAACNEFWGVQKKRVSAHEKLKLLAVTGGVPRYLEEIQPQLSAEENIHRLCFQEGAMLYEEFGQIFSSLFSRRGPLYREILKHLARGASSPEALYGGLRREKSGVISDYLEDLKSAGFISFDHTWNLKDGSPSNLRHYRLSDNYSRFYLKYIEPNKTKIQTGQFLGKSLSGLPGWEAVMGLQFENLVLNNRPLLWELLHINPADIVSDNPFFQRRNANQQGCQIDYLIQTRFNTLYVCEIKFAKNMIKAPVIGEVQKKMDRLKKPKNFSTRPILIHSGSLSPEISESGFFDQMIDFESLFDRSPNSI